MSSYIGGVPFADPAHFPNVDVYAEKGSGIDTLVGLGLTDLTVGQLVTGTTEFFTHDGDINQEDITNDAVNAWTAMSCWQFRLTDNPGVNHFELPGSPHLLARLITEERAQDELPMSSTDTNRLPRRLIDLVDNAPVATAKRGLLTWRLRIINWWRSTRTSTSLLR